MSTPSKPGGAPIPLAERRCTALESGVPPLERVQCQRLLAELAEGWRLAEDCGSLERTFRFRDFYHTMSFLNCIAHVANLEDHHPDLTVSYGHIGLTYSTHSIKGLSENDFICAAKIDRIELS